MSPARRDGLRPVGSGVWPEFETALLRQLLVQRAVAPEEPHLVLWLDQTVRAGTAAVDDVGQAGLGIREDEKVVPDELELDRRLLRCEGLQVELLDFTIIRSSCSPENDSWRAGIRSRAGRSLAGSASRGSASPGARACPRAGRSRSRTRSSSRGREGSCPSPRPWPRRCDQRTDRGVGLQRQLDLDLSRLGKLPLDSLEFFLGVSPDRDR